MAQQFRFGSTRCHSKFISRKGREFKVSRCNRKSAKSFKNSEIILKEASQRYAKREAVLKRANLKIQWDKQGKHIENHRNYKILENKSILKHSDPQKLIDNFAGTGTKIGKTTFGEPGFKELINFNEDIGYYVYRETGEKFSTTWGIIHYAKDGTHIVPAKPR